MNFTIEHNVVIKADERLLTLLESLFSKNSTAQPAAPAETVAAPPKRGRASTAKSAEPSTAKDDSASSMSVVKDPEPDSDDLERGENISANTAKVLTLEDCRTAMEGKLDKRDEIKSVLKSMGVEKLTALSQDQYPVFIQKMAAI